MSDSVRSELQGTIVSIEVAAGDTVPAGATLALVESMKLHHEITAPIDGAVLDVVIEVGSTVHPGDVVVELGPVPDSATVPVAAAEATTGPRGLERRDLSDVLARRHLGTDDARPEAVERRRAKQRRTARENVADLIDDGTFVEYGPLVIAAQAKRRSHDDLVTRTPADGMIGGIGTVNGDRFEGRDARVIAVSYDYTVMAGTQGHRNHRKKDRLFELAEQLRAARRVLHRRWRRPTR